MVVFHKINDNLKSSDNEEEGTFVYRELRNEVDDEERKERGGAVGNDDSASVSSSGGRGPRVTEVSVCQHDEINSNCSTVISTVLLVLLICLLLIVGRDYVRNILVWLETQEEWIVFILFIALFTLVSFPFTWGYILLNIACGYLQGLVLGVVVVVVAVACGVVIAHALIKRFLCEFLKDKLLSNNSIRATLAVVGGPNAFRVVAFTRLTPIPFGLQNAIFAISTISTGQYLAATLLGLFPTQVINVYLGSTVRSMEDILSDDNTTMTGYVVFGVQIVISIVLMAYVIQRARQELQKTVHFEVIGDFQEVSVTSPEYYKGGCSSI